MQAFALRMSEAFIHGNYDEGNALLEELMDRQDVTSPPDDPKRGNFVFYAGDKEVSDLNGLAFAGIHLGFVVLEKSDHIDASLRQRLFDQTLPECLMGYDGHYRGSGQGSPGQPMPRWWHSNIWFLTTAGRLMMARALGRDDHVEIARQRLAAVRLYTERYGIGEYNSPTYLGDQLHGLHFCWYYAPDDAFRADAAALLDDMYLDLAEHYHPASEAMAGAWSRHYEQDVEGTRHFNRYTDAAFGGSEPSYLERFGLKDYRCPESFRGIAHAERPYLVRRRHLNDVRRTLYQAPEYSLGTQSGRYVGYVADTPLMITYAIPERSRRIAAIRNPYWSAYVHHAADYAVGFQHWAHQHENAAILSSAQTRGGNDLLFTLADVDQFEPVLADAQGTALTVPRCPLMPAPPNREPGRPENPHRPNRSEELTFMEPAERPPPGAPVDGPVLAVLPSCYVAVIPGDGLTLHAAVMREQMQIVIPVRPTAFAAVVVVGKGEADSLDAFAARVREVTLEVSATPGVAVAARLSGWGSTLTAGRDPNGRLFDRRVDDLPVEGEEYLCYSPYQKRRAGERIGRGQNRRILPR